MTEKHFIIWEVRKDTKQVILHRIVLEHELKQALEDVARTAIGEVRYVDVKDRNTYPSHEHMYR